MNDNALIFNREQARAHRDRAAPRFALYRDLLMEAAERLADRLEDIRREFPVALDLGCHTGELSHVLNGRGHIKTLIQCDPSRAMVAQTKGPRVVCDAESLPFAPASFDLVMSVLSLHWVNDLPGAFAQIRHMLKPDGLFLAVLPGPKTLRELRESLADAEMETEGGVSPRISPFVEVRDAGNLLQRAGFALPVADTETLTVHYQHPVNLLEDLRGLGETNALLQQKKSLRRKTLEATVEKYQQKFGESNGSIPATLELVTLTAWAPHDSQQKPSPRGSGTVSLVKALQ